MVKCPADCPKPLQELMRERCPWCCPSGFCTPTPWCPVPPPGGAGSPVLQPLGNQHCYSVATSWGRGDVQSQKPGCRACFLTLLTARSVQQVQLTAAAGRFLVPQQQSRRNTWVLVSKLGSSSPIQWWRTAMNVTDGPAHTYSDSKGTCTSSNFQ